METFKYPAQAQLAKMRIDEAGALGGSAAEWYARARSRHRALREQITEPHNPFEEGSFRNFWFRVTYEGTCERLLATQAQ
jgi:fatty-acid desaturase